MKFKAPIFQFAISAMLGGLLTYYIIDQGLDNKVRAQDVKKDSLISAKTSGLSASDCNEFKMKSRDGFSFVKPLLYTEQDCESSKLNPLKEDINNLIESKKSAGLLTSVSVYVRTLNKGDWTTYNDGETFHPASLNKVATLITYLRAAETTPNLLDQKIIFENHDNNINYAAYSSKSLQPDKAYSVKDLLHYMIAYSDNESTILLLKNINSDFHYKTYTDLGLPRPSSMVGSTELTAKEFSVFMKVLYHATYLSPAGSEFCCSLLSECDFKDGLMKGIPANVKVSHKFGEFSDGRNYELHESGIVYNDSNPYIITVMTKGPERKELSEVISEVSDMVYRKLSARNNTNSAVVNK